MAKKTKEGFLKRLKKIVSSHLYDLGNKVLNEGIENAKDLHDVEIPVNKGLKSIIAEAIAYNKKAKAEWKASRSEMKELLSSASKQVVLALKNDKEGLTTDEDKFLESLDLDLDDFEFEDDDADDTNDEFEFESMDLVDGNYVGVDEDAINSKLWLLVKTGPNLSHDEELVEIVNQDSEALLNCIKGIKNVESEDTCCDDDSKLEMAKALIDEVQDGIAPNLGLEDDMYNENDSDEDVALVVVEVIPTEIPIRESNDTLVLKTKVAETIKTYFDNIDRVIAQDKLINETMTKFHDKLDTVVRYLSAKTNRSFNDIESIILKPICCDNHLEAGIAMYLSILPNSIISAGQRLVTVYNKIKKQEEK